MFWTAFLYRWKTQKITHCSHTTTISPILQSFHSIYTLLMFQHPRTMMKNPSINTKTTNRNSIPTACLLLLISIFCIAAIPRATAVSNDDMQSFFSHDQNPCRMGKISFNRYYNDIFDGTSTNSTNTTTYQWHACQPAVETACRAVKGAICHYNTTSTRDVKEDNFLGAIASWEASPSPTAWYTSSSQGLRSIKVDFNNVPCPAQPSSPIHTTMSIDCAYTNKNVFEVVQNSPCKYTVTFKHPMGCSSANMGAKIAMSVVLSLLIALFLLWAFTSTSGSFSLFWTLQFKSTSPTWRGQY